jgi:hypothetical protein
LKNNVSTPEQKRISLSDLDESQMKKLEKLVEKDTELWNKITNE